MRAFSAFDTVARVTWMLLLSWSTATTWPLATRSLQNLATTCGCAAGSEPCVQTPLRWHLQRAERVDASADWDLGFAVEVHTERGDARAASLTVFDRVGLCTLLAGNPEPDGGGNSPLVFTCGPFLFFSRWRQRD